jgi:hypothetical protein
MPAKESLPKRNTQQKHAYRDGREYEDRFDSGVN